jgi:hypothetical protein
MEILKVTLIKKSVVDQKYKAIVAIINNGNVSSYKLKYINMGNTDCRMKGDQFKVEVLSGLKPDERELVEIYKTMYAIANK